MFKKLDLIQCGIILVMLVFIPFKGTHPILFTIGGWLGTVGILVGFISVRMINKMERNKEHSLRYLACLGIENLLRVIVISS